MKKFTLFLFVIFLFLFISNQTRASHAVGGNLTFTYVGPNQYQVTYKFYRDCSSLTQAPNPADLYFTSASCGTTGSDTLTLIQVNVDITTGPYPPCNTISTCNGGTGYGIEEYVYSGLITLPSACNDWVLSTYVNARNAIITTIAGPGGLNLYLDASLDNLNAPVNSSPVFASYPVSRFCIGHTFNFSQQAIDPDGDSLVYSLVDALTCTFGIPPIPSVVPYNNPPYSGTNPILSTPPVTIDPNTGVITLNPTNIEVGVIAVLVQEYRNGVLIGSTRRDMQVNIEGTCNFPPTLSGDSTSGNQPATFNVGVILCGDSIIRMHLPTPVTAASVAQDGSDFRLVSPGNLPIPVTREVPLNIIGGLTDSLELHLYPPNLNENGTYILYSKVGNDGNTLLSDCGLAMREYDTVTFNYTNCYPGIVDLKNVSVSTNNTSIEVTWEPPNDTIWPQQFQSFDVYRANYPTGGYSLIRSVTNPSSRMYADTSADVPAQPYDYAVRLHFNYGYTGPYSDSIQSIFLAGSFNPDSLTMDLHWTPYWGWTVTDYVLFQSDDAGNTFFMVDNANTPDTSFRYTRPLASGHYVLRIETTHNGYVARSNWYEFDIVKNEVLVPNVITPNGDGWNDSFSIENLDNYPNSKLNIFNRWGRKIYESANYANDWKGEDFPEGVYFYTLKLADDKSTEVTGTLSIIRSRNK